MNLKELEEQGFVFESLPSNRINVRHKKQFVLNGINASSAGRGEWIRTLEVKGFDEAANYIKTIDFV